VNTAFFSRHEQKTRRIVWIIRCCLELPPSHPLRRQRLPILANELAKHAKAAPPTTARPN
jgi:hypothetical protein